MNKDWIRIFAIVWPLIVANSFWTLQMTIDRIFLEPTLSNHSELPWR